MPDFEFDIVVIGSGPGGEGAAMQAAKRGRSVAVVERDPLIGGNCTHVGTIPSKALRYAIFQMMEVNANPLYRQHGVSIHLTIPELLRSSRSVIDKQVAMRTNFYERNDVPILRGEARFLDPEHVEILQLDGAKLVVRGNAFVIAVGARPYRPPDVEFDGDRVFDSDTILTLRRPLRTITIYGAGVIGCEYASMFRNLDSKVNLVNTRAKLLEFLDDEIIDALSYHLRDRGVLLRHNEVYERVELLDDGVVVHLKSGKALKSDALLWASGRTGNSDCLNLGAVGLTPDSRGNLPVNEHMQTPVPHVYAVGDINGVPALASAAYMQGRYAASHILGERELPPITDVPTGIYTSPEISSLGKTERELTADKVPYEVGHSQFKSLARAQITGRTVGMLKLLFHRETLEILGIHCFGANASEIIHIGQAIMRQPPPNNTLRYFVNTTFNYPTMAEAYRVAALNGLNRLF